MGETILIQAGLEVIADSLDQHHESTSLANDHFESGFSKLERAKNLLAQATAEIDGARIDFQQAVDTSTDSEAIQVAARNASQASGVSELEQGPARELSFFLDRLTGETGKLTGFYTVNVGVARTILTLLGHAHKMVNAHLDSSRDPKIYARVSHCNDKARQAVTQIVPFKND